MFSSLRDYLLQRGPRLLPCLVLLVGSLNVVFVGGKRRTFAVFITALRQDFNETSRAELNWIGDSYTGVAFMLMPLVTNCIIDMDRAYQKGMALAALLIGVSCLASSFTPSPSLLFLTHTVLHGVGSSLVLSCTALVVGEYFDKDHRFHVLATTLISGGPYGALVFGPIYGNLVEAFGWRAAFRVIGATFVIEVGLGVLFYFPKHGEYDTLNTSENPPDITEDPTAEHQQGGSVRRGSSYITKEDLKNPSELNSLKKRPLYSVIPRAHLQANLQILLWMVERVLHNIVLYSLMMNLVELMSQANGMTISQATSINLLFGIGESITFTFGVAFGDRLRGRLALTYCISTVLASGLLLAAGYAFEQAWLILLLTVFLGMTVGTGNTCVYATSEEVMRIHGSIAFSSTKMMAGIGLFLAPIFSGHVIDTHGYFRFFVCQSALSASRFVLLVAILYMLYRKDQANPPTEMPASGKLAHGEANANPNNGLGMGPAMHQQYGKDENVRVAYSAIGGGSVADTLIRV